MSGELDGETLRRTFGGCFADGSANSPVAAGHDDALLGEVDSEDHAGVFCESRRWSIAPETISDFVMTVSDAITGKAGRLG
jgi:hypothetical protein